MAAPLQLVAVGGEDPVQGVPHDHEHSGLWLRVEKLDEWLMRKEGDEFSGKNIDLPELAVSPRQVGHNLT